MKTLFFRNLMDLIYPKICTGCENPLVSNEDTICLSCRAELPRTGLHRFKDNIIHRKFTGRCEFAKASSYLYYSKSGIVQSLIHKLKYKGETRTGETLGNMIAYDLGRDGFFDDIDVIVPIPLHPRKLKKRGYNQSEKIADGLASLSHLDISLNNLYRVHSGDSQTRKSRYDRWLNVSNAFAVRDPEYFKCKHLLLLDDVVTTGATVEGAFRALQAIRGVRLSLLTLATPG